MGRLQTQGKLLIGGGFMNNSGAMGRFLADDIEHACDIGFADPVVQNKIVTAEVHPWLVTVPGCIGMEGCDQ